MAQHLTLNWVEDPNLSTAIIDHALNIDVLFRVTAGSHAYAGDAEFAGCWRREARAYGTPAFELRPMSRM
jgi:hypothetical protein